MSMGAFKHRKDGESRRKMAKKTPKDERKSVYPIGQLHQTKFKRRDEENGLTNLDNLNDRAEFGDLHGWSQINILLLLTATAMRSAYNSTAVFHSTFVVFYRLSSPIFR